MLSYLIVRIEADFNHVVDASLTPLRVLSSSKKKKKKLLFIYGYNIN
jgi:hypothetical protein